MEKFDIVIIGAGASGLASSWYLTDKGYKVACFEQGDFLREDSLIDLNQGGEIQKYGCLSPDPNLRRSKADYLIDSSRSPIHIANYNGVGGATILFSAQYPRLTPNDFKVFSNDKVGKNWPIDYKEIIPFYDLNDKITGLSGLSGDNKEPFAKPSMPPVPFGSMGRKLIEGFEKLNWHWWPAYSSINTLPYDNRPADNYLRPSNLAGGLDGSKGSTNNTYLPKAMTHGLILKRNSRVVKLIKDPANNLIEKIKYLNEIGQECFAKAKVFILAASGIGTPRLLLSSNNGINSRGIANSSDMVGRNLMLHPLGYIEGHFLDNLDSNIGPQGCCLLSQEFYETNPDRDFKRGYTFQVIRGPLPIELALNLTSRKLLKFGENFFRDFNSIYNHTAHMTVITEDLPDKENRVTIKKSFEDTNNPSVQIDYTLSDNTKRMLIHGINNGRKLMKASGAKKSYAFGPVRNTGWHTLGTCCMGNNPKESVVNKYGKTHDIDNLFIVDGSIFTTSGGVNPASTIQALSLYVSSKIDTVYKHLF
ncbi:GMC oxidoreductase [Prochlorococcus marinus]|uniref:GMC oxidoreductase n=1 Tax=Prochlorococcus marinus TaxID=1219 RepID=UPI0022B39033|nr:GMC family oxidoreductase [Prochlorococcus marinus]